MTANAEVLELRPGDREVLAGWLRVRTLPHRLVERAQIVLAAAVQITPQNPKVPTVAHHGIRGLNRLPVFLDVEAPNSSHPAIPT